MDYTSEDFNVAKISEYTLLISTMGIAKHAIAVIDQAEELQLLTEYDPSNPSEKVEKVFGLPFERVKISVPQLGFTAIPKELYDRTQHKLYEAYMPSYGLKDPVISVTNAGDTMMYLTHLDKHTSVQYLNRFPSAKLFSRMEVLFQNALTIVEPPPPNSLFVYRESGQASIICIQENSVVYYNDFEAKEVDDIKYYFSHIMRELGFSLSESALYLAGDLTENHVFYDAFVSHFANTDHVDLEDILHTLAPDACQPAEYRFFMLLGLNACE